MTQLQLSDGSIYSGESFGAVRDSDGEVVFNTAMAGYPESLTDPSYRGQILVFTYPLIGNYGVPSQDKNKWGFADNFESEDIHVRGVIVSQESREYSHHNAVSSLHNWLEHHNIPGITGVDTRALTKKLREEGVMLGSISQDGSASGDIPDPNETNLVAEVSCKEVVTYEPEGEVKATVAAFDCGIKNNILRCWLQRGVRVHRLPWDYNLAESDLSYDALFLSNGPGDPKRCNKTIEQIQKAIENKVPTFGICLGNQLLALAIGGDTYKLPYGHRGQNQPCIELQSAKGEEQSDPRCIITSQNHGFAVSEELPEGWRVWYKNANDGSVEGIAHESGTMMSVQFHPEATPGPEDAEPLFDRFLESIS